MRMVTMNYPGVYVEEVPSGIRAISGVSTSVTAFVGRAMRGPVDEPVRVSNFGEYTRRFGGLALTSTMSYAVLDFFRNGGTQAVVVRVARNAAPAAVEVPAGGDTLRLLGANPGSWGNALKVTVEHDPADANLYSLTVDAGIGTPERFLNVSVDPASRRFVTTVLAESSNLVRVRDGSAVPAGRPDEGEHAATAASGSDGDPVADAEILGDENAKTGMYALSRLDLFNILCLPPPARDADIAPNTWQTALEYCKDRRAFLVVDPPLGWTANPANAAQTAATGVAALGLTAASHGAVYMPRVVEADPLLDGTPVAFAPSGMVAGILARTDAERGVWKAPAGLDAVLVGAQRLDVVLTNDDQALLNPVGVNCLRDFGVNGRVVWGARTTRGADQLADEYKYVPIRRLALFIEESLFRGTQWVVFEPNDEPLWSQIRLNVGAFMHRLFRQGAFQGTKPSEAYFVKCDSETTPPEDVNLGIVNIHVGFAPLKPAEFVVLKIEQIAQATS